MPQLVPLATMIAKLEGLVGTRDLSDWETKFVKNVVDRTSLERHLGLTLSLSGSQVEKIEELHARHFG